MQVGRAIIIVAALAAAVAKHPLSRWWNRFIDDLGGGMAPGREYRPIRRLRAWSDRNILA